MKCQCPYDRREWIPFLVWKTSSQGVTRWMGWLTNCHGLGQCDLHKETKHLPVEKLFVSINALFLNFWWKCFVLKVSCPFWTLQFTFPNLCQTPSSSRGCNYVALFTTADLAALVIALSNPCLWMDATGWTLSRNFSPTLRGWKSARDDSIPPL